MIYTPRAVVDLLFHPMCLDQKNKSTCTKIVFKGFEISVVMDSNHTDSDLTRSDIRVYSVSPGQANLSYYGWDRTEDFIRAGLRPRQLDGNAETLLRIMNMIDTGVVLC